MRVVGIVLPLVLAAAAAALLCAAAAFSPATQPARQKITERQTDYEGDEQNKGTLEHKADHGNLRFLRLSQRPAKPQATPSRKATTIAPCSSYTR